MHRRAVQISNARLFWLWRVPNTPHCDQLGTGIGNRTYNRKPMQTQSHAWKLIALLGLRHFVAQELQMTSFNDVSETLKKAREQHP